MPPRDSAESTALRLLDRGYWPTVTHPGEKRPIGNNWGEKRKSLGEVDALFRSYPTAGVGIVLGPGRAPGGGWLIDLEGDGPQAFDSLAKLFDGEIVETTGWDSVRGSHNLFVADDDFLDGMMAAGATEGKGHGKSGVWKLPEFPDLEFRIGGYKPDGAVKQVHSACPPTVGTDGNPRRWNGVRTLAKLPTAAIENLRKIALAKPAQAEPSPVPVVIPMRLPDSPGRPGAADRARAYLMSAGFPAAVEGSRGHDRLYHAACVLVDGFGLSFGEAYPVMVEYNQAKAVPPESDHQIRHKLNSAIEKNPAPSLSLLNADRPDWTPRRQAVGKAEETSVIEVVADEDVEDVEVVDRWPKVNPAMYHGFAGDFVRSVAPETEADPVATLVQVLTGFGNLVGRGPHFVVSSTRHPLVVNAVVVGATAVGRKGTSGDDAEFCLGNVDPHWQMNCCRNGLTTGEGLISLVRDPKYRPPTSEEIRKGHPRDELILVDEGIVDKRLYLIETEFAKVPKMSGHVTNTLSETLRQTFDGKKRIGNLSKHNGNVATDAHVSVVGHITRADIRKCLSETDMLNGFGNRFLWVAARRSKELPDGGNMLDLDLRQIFDGMRRARDFAVGLGDHRMTFDDEFRRVWRDIYHELSSDQRHVMAARSEAYCKRLSCVYALLDQTAVVGVQHLMASLALLDYVNQTIEYVFGAAVPDPNEAKLIAALKGASDGLTRGQINHDVFGRHLKAKAIADVLGNLLTRGAVHSRTESTGRGRPAERWFIGRGSGQTQPSQN